MKNVLAANWKMNKGPDETTAFFKQFISLLSEAQQDNLVFFVPAVDWVATSVSIKNTALKWGSQNCYFEDSGAFTGENSPEILKTLGGQYCLVGHSERRQIFKETDEDVNKKTLSLLKKHMTPMICVGETLGERNANRTTEVVIGQLQKALVEVSESVVVAYEPVWAIGTGQVATPEMANDVHCEIRSYLISHFGQKIGQEIPILYGGSVKPNNAAELILQSEINGFLVGGASLDASVFAELAKITFG